MSDFAISFIFLQTQNNSNNNILDFNNMMSHYIVIVIFIAFIIYSTVRNRSARQGAYQSASDRGCCKICLNKKKRLFVFLLTFTLLQQAATKTIDEKQVIKMAKQFYVSQGYTLSRHHDIEVLDLLQKVYVINFVESGDKHPAGYVIAAGDDLVSPILAFSNQGRIDIKNETMQKILNGYVEEVTTAQNGQEQTIDIDTTYYQKQQNTCTPLLEGIAWGQNSPYNQLLPLDIDNGRYLVGCTAVAIGQVMKYYNYPSQATGISYYISANEKRTFSAAVDYSLLNIPWDQVQGKYAPQDTLAAKETVSKILYHCALSVESDFSSKNTTAFTREAMIALFKYFCYHPSIRSVGAEDIPDKELQELFYRELDAKRPVIVNAHQHTFVCDGFIDDFFHFNWGWNGTMNGYFKLSALKPGKDNFNLASHVIVNIFPKSNNKEQEETVSVVKAGTLAQCIPLDKLMDVISLKITGELDGSDLNLLCKMAGAIESVWESGGKLQSLDLSDVKFVSDYKAPYISEDAKKMRWAPTFTKKSPNGTIEQKVFQFEHMTDTLWKEFCDLKGNVFRDGEQRVVKQGDSYYIQHFVRSNVIGPYLFRNCRNLKQLKLPLDTKVIRQGAFSGCSLLQTLEIPSQVVHIQGNVWDKCISLESIHVNENNLSFKSEDGVLYDKNRTNLVCYPSYRKAMEYNMPEAVKTVEPNAFAGSQFLKKIKLSPAVNCIRWNTFSHCTSLQVIKLPESVTEIQSWAFYGCRNLSVVVLPQSLSVIGDNVFGECRNLTGVFCGNPSPPSVTGKVFYGLEENKKLVLWVTAGCVDKYRSSNWGCFKQIEEM